MTMTAPAVRQRAADGSGLQAIFLVGQPLLLSHNRLPAHGTWQAAILSGLLHQFDRADHSISAIYEHLAIADIQGAAALAKDPQLKEFSGLVQDFGRGAAGRLRPRSRKRFGLT